MIGAATLVPPIIVQPRLPSYSVESYTATPVYGSASAETSATARRDPQPTAGHAAKLCCHVSAVKLALQPPPPAPNPSGRPFRQPPSFRTLSRSQALDVAFSFRRVPPTAITWGELAGYSAAL